MATEIIMPQMGFDMKEGTVVRWIKHEGDAVARGDVLAEIETDKAVVEVESFDSGVLRKIAVQEGVTVPVGQIIGVIGAADEEISEVAVAAAPSRNEAPPAEAAALAAPVEPAIAQEAPAVAAAPARQDKERLRASPLARREAESRKLDIALVPGTGPSGRITRDDVIRYAEAGAPAAAAPAPAAAPPPVEAPRPQPAPGEVVPLSRMRRAIATNMARSKQEIPHFYVTVEIDMTEAVCLRAQINEALAGETRVSINDMVIRACAKAIPGHRVFNSSFTDAGLQIRGEINIGMAVALEEGLIAPAIVDADKKSLVELAQASRRVVERARSGVLSAAEYTSATFNVTNLGMFDVESFSAIITPPQSAALAVGAVRAAPVVRDGVPAIAELMKATLSIDHRVADGAQAAAFLQEVRRLLENPVSLMV